MSYARRYGVTLRSGGLDPLPPLPIVFAQGLRELGVDLDQRYIRGYVKRFLRALPDLYEQLPEDVELDYEAYRRDVREMLKTRLRLDGRAINKYYRRNGWSHHSIKEVSRAMPDEASAWRRLLGKDRFNRVAGSALGDATRIYALPKDSGRFVRSSGRPWKL